MNTENTNNIVTLQGTVTDEPVFSHELYGESFYEFHLKVSRLSETHDIIPITISNRLMQEQDVTVGNELNIMGQFRSYNKLVDGKSKLMLTVFVLEFVSPEDIFSPNEIEITGYICKEPIYRVTPFKREICDLLIAVNRSYNKSDYLPCIAWGRNARYIRSFNIGDKVTVIGRIQSREYTKKLDNDQVVTKVAYEVSLSKIITDRDSEYRIAEYDADAMIV